MPELQNKVVFITGASSGIGAALAREASAQGATVALAARRIDKLDALSHEIERGAGKGMALRCDVCDRASVNAAVEKAVEVFGRLNVVIANAGFGISGPALSLDTGDYRRQFETNVFGVLDTVHATLPHLIKTRGRLALVGSVMGRMGMPASAPYCASKFAVVGLAESLYYDLAEVGVSVTCINPGLIASEIRSINNSGVYSGKPDPAPKRLIMPAEVAAKKILRAIVRRQPEYVVTKHGKFVVWMARHLPRTSRAILRLASKGRMDKIQEAKRAVD